MGKRIIGLTLALVVLTLLFWAVEFLWPSQRGQKRLRAGVGTDLLYWFFTPLVSKTLSQVGILVAIAAPMLMLGRKLDRATVMAGHGPALALPRWAQALIIVVLGDLIAYWSHRWFHGRGMWAFHAVHHSSKELDWLSSVRLHPVNDIVTRVMQAAPFVVLGFSPTVLAGYLPFLTFYSIFIHANVSWTFGPLRYVIATPLFHQWHHTKEDEAIDKNFAGMLPVWDWMFGTLYLPKGKVPTEFGVHDDSVPENFAGQMIYPFLSRKARREMGRRRREAVSQQMAEARSQPSR